MPDKTVPFVLCDVFAEIQFEGNQPAVITRAWFDAFQLTFDDRS